MPKNHIYVPGFIKGLLAIWLCLALIPGCHVAKAEVYGAVDKNQDLLDASKDGWTALSRAHGAKE
jgi:hypothetical protein